MGYKMKTKTSEDLSIQELQANIKERKERLKELEEQDETNFTDNDKMYRGKDVNIPLVKNHIIYYTNLLNKKLKGSLLEFV